MGYSARTGRHPWWPPNVKTRLAAIFFPAPGDADRHALAPAARALEDELVHLELDRHGVFAGKAGGAKTVLRLLHGAHEALDREGGEALRAQLLPHLFHLLVGRDQPPLRSHIDPQAARDGARGHA